MKVNGGQSYIYSISICRDVILPPKTLNALDLLQNFVQSMTLIAGWLSGFESRFQIGSRLPQIVLSNHQLEVSLGLEV